MYFDKSVYEFIHLVIFQVFVDFHHLIPDMIFCGYGNDYYMPFGSGYYVSKLPHSYLVASSIVVF